MVNVGDRVRVKNDTRYDDPELTVLDPKWDGVFFGGREGEVFQILEGGITVARVDVEGVSPGITGRGWTFEIHELEVI